MFLDGLEDAYEKGRLMGEFAEDCATTHQFTREMQDDYAMASLLRAQQAARERRFRLGDRAGRNAGSQSEGDDRARRIAGEGEMSSRSRH